MAVSTLPNRIVREQKTIPINWASTTNPSWYTTTRVDISKAGFVPIAVSYNVSGPLGSFVMVTGCRIVPSENTLYCECRMVNQIPESLTQNALVVTITYLKL